VNKTELLESNRDREVKSLPKKENSTIEFKSSFGDETIETLAAFANTKGGKVLVGVANNSISFFNPGGLHQSITIED